jgi:hypothetical protein
MERGYKLSYFVGHSHRGEPLAHQCMMSKYMHGTAEEAILRAKTIAEEMRRDGISLLRVKVEASGYHPCVPMEEGVGTSDTYFEFHLQYQVQNTTEYERLQAVLRAFPMHTMLSHNLKKQTVHPVVTLRVPGTVGLRAAMERKNEMMRALKGASFHTNARMHVEYCVYDDYVELDDTLSLAKL